VRRGGPIALSRRGRLTAVRLEELSSAATAEFHRAFLCPDGV